MQDKLGRKWSVYIKRNPAKNKGDKIAIFLKCKFGACSEAQRGAGVATLVGFKAQKNTKEHK